MGFSLGNWVMVINAVNLYKNIGVNNTSGLEDSLIIPKGDTKPNEDSTRANGGVSENGDTVNVSVEGKSFLKAGRTEEEKPYLQEGEEQGAAAAVSYNAKQMGITEDAVELNVARNEVKVFSENLETIREERAEESREEQNTVSKAEKEDFSTGNQEKQAEIAEKKEDVAAKTEEKREDIAAKQAEKREDIAAKQEKNRENIATKQAEKREDIAAKQAERRNKAEDAAAKQAAKAEKPEEKEDITAKLANKTEEKENIATVQPDKTEKNEINVKAPENTAAEDNKEKEDKERYALNRAYNEDNRQEKLQADKRFDASLTDKAQEKRAENTEERIDFQKERNSIGNAGNIYSEDPKDNMYKVVLSFDKDPNEVASTTEELDEDAFMRRLRDQNEENRIENITVNISAPENNEENAPVREEAAETVNSEAAAAAQNTGNAETAAYQSAQNTVDQNAADNRVIVQEV